nr:hypothetical protein Iba_chr04cCG6610 [Ipomoea batatas]
MAAMAILPLMTIGVEVGMAAALSAEELLASRFSIPFRNSCSVILLFPSTSRSFIIVLTAVIRCTSSVTINRRNFSSSCDDICSLLSESYKWLRLGILIFLSRSVSPADYYTETPKYCEVKDGGSGVNPDTKEHLVLCTLLAVEYPRRYGHDDSGENHEDSEDSSAENPSAQSIKDLLA